MSDNKHKTGPWRPCKASDGKCRCGLIHDVNDDVTVAVALSTGDVDYTGGDQ